SALVLIFPMGAASIAFIATANATLQLRADPAMRGRVMALYAIAFLGSTPIGAPLVGWISDTTSPRVALLVGGVATLAASLPLAMRYGGLRREKGGGEVVELSRRPAAGTDGAVGWAAGGGRR